MRFKCNGPIGKNTAWGSFERCSREFVIEDKDVKVLPPKCPYCGANDTHRID